MLGWEFPPFISGGLGTACYGLTKAMSQLGINITFVFPKNVNSNYTGHVKMLNPCKLKRPVSAKSHNRIEVTLRPIKSLLQPYSTPQAYQERFQEVLAQHRQVHTGKVSSSAQVIGGTDYSGDMYSEVYRYAAVAAQLAESEQFDIVHAHDWMTYPAGIAVSKMSGKPLVVHIHSTEFDRSREDVNQMIYDIEREGMHAADKIIAVSFLTRNIIISRYGVSSEKVEVVHNGVERSGNRDSVLAQSDIDNGEKIVLFLGRITMQKGPRVLHQGG